MHIYCTWFMRPLAAANAVVHLSTTSTTNFICLLTPHSCKVVKETEADADHIPTNLTTGAYWVNMRWVSACLHHHHYHHHHQTEHELWSKWQQQQLKKWKPEEPIRFHLHATGGQLTAAICHCCCCCWLYSREEEKERSTSSGQQLTALPLSFSVCVWSCLLLAHTCLSIHLLLVRQQIMLLKRMMTTMMCA